MSKDTGFSISSAERYSLALFELSEENNLLSEEFEFNKINSDVSDHIYELKRNINFKISFNRMVNAWIEERGY